MERKNLKIEHAKRRAKERKSSVVVHRSPRRPLLAERLGERQNLEKKAHLTSLRWKKKKKKIYSGLHSRWWSKRTKNALQSRLAMEKRRKSNAKWRSFLVPLLSSRGCAIATSSALRKVKEQEEKRSSKIGRRSKAWRFSSDVEEVRRKVRRCKETHEEEGLRWRSCWRRPGTAWHAASQQSETAAADRFGRPVVDLERASRRAAAAASDTKHGQTAWRPPVSFVPAPASRRPRNVHRPNRATDQIPLRAQPTDRRRSAHSPRSDDPLSKPILSKPNFSLQRRNVVSSSRLISLPIFLFFFSFRFRFAGFEYAGKILRASEECEEARVVASTRRIDGNIYCSATRKHSDRGFIDSLIYIRSIGSKPLEVILSLPAVALAVGKISQSRPRYRNTGISLAR